MTPILLRTALAEEDLIGIWLRVAADDPGAADRLLDDLDQAAQLLAANPGMGPARDDIAPGFRYFPIRNYLFLYRIIDNGIQAVRFIHGARDVFSLTLTG